MAYDEPAYRRRDGETDSTARVTGGYGQPETAYRPEGSHRRDEQYPATAETRAPDHTEPPRVSPASLEDAFDDPNHGEVGRDRMAVHFLWEFVLLLAGGGLAYLLYAGQADAVTGAALDTLLVQGAALGMLALGAGATLRTAAPNLAIGPVAVASALHFAENGDTGVVQAAGIALVIGLLGGLILALVVVGFHVPGWAASLAASLGVIVYIQLRPGPVDVQGDYDPTRHAIYLFGGFAALTIIGGLLGLIKNVRRTVGRFRPVGDPADRRGVGGAVMTTGAIVFSSVLAVVAGVLLAAGSADPVVPSVGLEWTGLALGAALVGGTSAYGRRGGVFGTLFAVAVLTLFLRYQDLESWDISVYATAAVAVGGGLVVTRLVETFGRPAPAPDTQWTEPPAATTWQAPPAEPGPAPRTDPWDSTRWGS
ncbi:ribose/xylose/arabinose/galactoside ABC-type transport system permease subunit [Catenuloplanes nepalensis]|uniref:Ribose/xylose/arabinose/galactoside ABC-type transport system permease subunit n=1 Tax=Catenuloplanes nepalensis TaxID=587533 RepID=A0ABT9N3H5_9ACTN|nr:ABC transporter permease [Catenuloplanes nepalensis]MDP9798232.1 ribose/xylose/arabinose/galactoside ABC-type transport system permease subunit [Catenuloplanes nepalensis]